MKEALSLSHLGLCLRPPTTLHACILANPAPVLFMSSCRPSLSPLMFSETIWYLAVELSLHSVALTLMGLLYLTLGHCRTGNVVFTVLPSSECDLHILCPPTIFYHCTFDSHQSSSLALLFINISPHALVISNRMLSVRELRLRHTTSFGLPCLYTIGL